MQRGFVICCSNTVCNFFSQYAVIKDMMICFMAYVSNKSQIIHLKCENILSSHLAIQPET